MKTKYDFLKDLIEQSQYADKGYFQYAHIAACLLDEKYHEQLKQLVNGPIYDGDIICKAHREVLLDLGLAIRVCCGGEQGHTGATYFAYSVLKAVTDIKSGEIGA